VSIRLLAATIAAGLCAAAAAATALGRPTAAGPCSSDASVSTPSYLMLLDIGPQEDMYTKAEVKARHLKDGEIMLGGEMTMIGTPPPGMRIYHLEVHICNSAGKVVTRLDPRILVGGKPLPAATMVGIGQPMTDYHYGNDIILKPAAHLTVKVTVNGEVAVFHTTVPAK